MKNMQKSQMKDMGASEASMTYQDKMMQVMAEEMSWDKMKDDYISIYTQVFTEDELKGLMDFYKSPIGQKLVAKTPELTGKLMEMGQKHSAQVMPKLKAMAADMSKEMMNKAPEAATPAAPAAP